MYAFCQEKDYTSRAQSMGSIPLEKRKSFAFEKGLLPENAGFSPQGLFAPRGDGWLDLIIKTLSVGDRLSLS